MGTQKNRLNKLIGQEINAILGAQTVLIMTYVIIAIFLSFSLNLCLGCSKRCHNETVLLSTQNIFLVEIYVK